MDDPYSNLKPGSPFRPGPVETTKVVEIELPEQDSHETDEEYKEDVELRLRKAIPLGGRYIRHETRTVRKIIAKVTYEPPRDC